MAASQSAATIEGPAWDLSTEYAAPDSADVAEDLARLGATLDRLDEQSGRLAPHLPQTEALAPSGAGEVIAVARDVFALAEEAEVLLANLGTYAHCLLSVDSQIAPARALMGRLQTHYKRLAALAEPLAAFLDRASDEVVEAYLANDATAPARFAVEHSRKRRHERLDLAQENLVSALSQDGIHAWGRLYDQLAGTIRCEVEGEPEPLGLAAASDLMQGPDEPRRERAWRGINQAWDEHGETCAAAINAIAGWRLELCRKRGRGQALPFLAAPLHANHMESATLDALFEAAEAARPLARRAARLQAKAYGKVRYGPWDQRAPAPVLGGPARPIEFDAAIDIIAAACGDVDASWGEFVRMMAAKRWIEGADGPRKQPGAYCATFPKSRSPRVYMKYSGAAPNVIILAHELGHALHSWTMRDLPESQRHYGMAIAETASTLGETIARDAMLKRAATPAEELAIVWEEASALVGFVLNIPTRFEFERNFHEARQERPLNPDELRDMMGAAWTKWYGDCLAEPDRMFWANKLHFYISQLSFYNFPYLFGYLFSLGLNARREAFGGEFFPRCVALLRDTGRMTVEELAAKHLEVDLSTPDFWRETALSLEPRINRLAALVDEVAT